MTIVPRHNQPLESVMAQEQEASDIKEIERLLNIKEFKPKLIGGNQEAITIPDSVYQVLRQVVQAMALGKAVSIITQNKELTTQQAADLLNVSRPYLIKLLEQGEIPYMMVGTHRRVKFEDLMKYKQKRDTERRKSLDELIAESQELGFYE
ncbi:helix-turn-helix domain-containing protein [Nostoc parmelioides]|uniref:Helix-turn-helix domain-containing protein n=1 Tax=Nostoc parmelioides FACHB-3921 TaxID=2692909 RepID=A0ABR8B8F7_9NOSO|nr:helix-turn-helix domain-containing protein [Nostoc parmelioides]MBD2249794.1 helix-turn-helix domain-containing protein [Nostoc parmelioides FACHB-3921]